eukprot:TRINITY_DN19408_c2_g1_i1.p1 TRINITY_DN19408_c2_g1~~TRINITY_DN19408_c2_g1_i1.p1  ORF type:complete len:734 (+),score=127.56 TRINITY_DN19408_c2_g1_i1:36-2237(+)
MTNELPKSASNLSAVSLALEEDIDLKRRVKCGICENQRRACALALVITTSVLTLLSPFAFYEGAGIVKPCRETTEAWRRYVLIAFCMAVLITALNSVVLLRWAAGSFKHVAVHATFVWAHAVLWTFFLMDTCAYAPAERKLRGLFHILCLISAAAVVAVLPSLVFERVKVFERNLFRDNGERRLRLLLRASLAALFMFIVFGVLTVATGNSLDGTRTPGLTEMLSISALAFCGFLMASYVLVLRRLAMASALTNTANRQLKATALRFDIQGDATVQSAARISEAARVQFIGTLIQVVSSLALVILGCLQNNLVWPLILRGVDVNLMSFIMLWLDCLATSLGSSFASGAGSGALRSSHSLEALRMLAQGRRQEAMSRYQKSQEEWQDKVEELAGRGFTLAALLSFYKQIRQFMPHFDSSQHTTTDVVREAIIPASSEKACSLAEVLMDGKTVRPKKMVTHNWGNVFRDLVAAIIADSLGEDEFCKVAYLLDHDVSTLESWLEKGDCFSTTYWVCAFSVSQHDGICAENPFGTRDTVTGELHPVCFCNKPKSFNDTPPTLDGRSINCEMNKFDDMIAYLAATDAKFSHVVAVDSCFVLFNRAWCIAELAMSYNMGMEQHLVIHSGKCLLQYEDMLRNVKVEKMKATRPEDVEEILAKIPDKAAFNEQLQRLIFAELLGNFDHLDSSQRMKRIGSLVRWQLESMRCEGLWELSFSTPAPDIAQKTKDEQTDNVCCI